MQTKCLCGRPVIIRAGDMSATCAECRSGPDSCDCPPLSKPKHAKPEQPPVLSGDPRPDEPWTELGYARRLVSVYGDRLRFVPAWNRWLVWDGQRWVPDETGQVPRYAKLTVRAMTDLVIADGESTREQYQTARRGESSGFISGMLRLASSEEEVAVAHTRLDADPFLLNCANGVLDLRTMQLGKHDPKLLLTKVTGAGYEPAAECPVFAKFLGKVQPDEGMRRFLARLLGHALEGRVTEHILPIFWGTGKNGKSTLVTAVTEALGDYAGPADADLLNAKTFDAHPTSVADLFGLRLARIDEGDKGRRLGEGTVKRLTGGDRLKARRMREDFWSFDPSHTFVMLTNHKPVIAGTDEGIWRRIRLVPWDVVIAEAERDRTLGDQLRLELGAILAWLAAGYADWRDHGLGEPDAVTSATSDYRGESDALGQFIKDMCMRQGQVKSSDLFAAWHKWCANENEDAGTQTAFSTELVNRGFDKQSKSSGNFWQGLCLTGPDRRDKEDDRDGG